MAYIKISTKGKEVLGSRMRQISSGGEQAPPSRRCGRVRHVEMDNSCLQDIVAHAGAAMVLHGSPFWHLGNVLR